MNTITPPQETMELIRKHRELAQELTQSLTRLKGIGDLPNHAQSECAKASITIQTALAVLSVAEADTRQAAIRYTAGATSDAVENEIAGYLNSAETVIETAEVLLFQALTGARLAAVGTGISIPENPDNAASV